MKKRKLRHPVTARITLWFSAVLLVTVTLILLVFRMVSASVLQKTTREYLLGVVGENTDKIRFLETREGAEPDDLDDVYIRYGKGWLEIDDDFLDRIYEVESALYTSDGKMLYGKNPIARQMEGEPFRSTRIYEREVDGVRYYIYDRKQTGTHLEDLWIRGVVSMDSARDQLRTIGRITLLFVPALLLGGIAGGFAIAQHMLRPLGRIEETALEISRGTDLRRRIEIGAGEDEIHALAEAFNGMLDRLERAFEAEQQFTADASHELRTPMAVILAQTELALEKDRSGEDYRRALRLIDRQGRRMSALIGGMLDYTRLHLHMERYPFERIDLSALVRSVTEDMALLRSREIEVTVRAEDGVSILGSRILMERLLQNLIDNAYKYGREGGHTQVRLSLEKKERGGDGANALLVVTDDGPGIPPEHTGRIFDRFYRADPSRNARIPGSGLGLSMVQRIAVLHGGSVTVRSEEGKGSSFFVTIPACF